MEMFVSMGLCSSRAFRMVGRAEALARASIDLGIVSQILESPYLRMGGFLRTFHSEEGLLKLSSATLPLEYLGFFEAMSWMPMMLSFSQVVVSASGVSLVLYLLLTAAGATLMVFARRWFRERSEG